MRKLNGITINGEYLGNSVVINAMFRAICTISPSVMREFIQIINNVETLDEAVKINNFNCVNDSIDIEFENKKQKGNASLSFAMKNGEPQLSDCKLAVGDEVYNSLDEFKEMVKEKKRKKAIEAKEKAIAKAKEKAKEKIKAQLKAKAQGDENSVQKLPQKIATKDENGNEIILEGKAAEEFFEAKMASEDFDDDFEILDEEYIENEIENPEEETSDDDWDDDFEEEESDEEEEYNDNYTEHKESVMTDEDDEDWDVEKSEGEAAESLGTEEDNESHNAEDDLYDSEQSIEQQDDIDKKESNAIMQVDDSFDEEEQALIKEVMGSDDWDPSDITKVNKCTIIAKSIKIEAAGFETNGSVMRPAAQQNFGGDFGNQPYNNFVAANSYGMNGAMPFDNSFYGVNPNIVANNQGHDTESQGQANADIAAQNALPQQGMIQNGMMPGYPQSGNPKDDDPIKLQMEAIQAELARLKQQTEKSKKLTTLDEFLNSQRKLEAEREKKRRERFRIIGSREHIRANALEGGLYVYGKRIYKWGEPKTLEE